MNDDDWRCYPEPLWRDHSLPCEHDQDRFIWHDPMTPSRHVVPHWRCHNADCPGGRELAGDAEKP